MSDFEFDFESNLLYFDCLLCQMQSVRILGDEETNRCYTCGDEDEYFCSHCLSDECWSCGKIACFGCGNSHECDMCCNTYCMDCDDMCCNKCNIIKYYWLKFLHFY